MTEDQFQKPEQDSCEPSEKRRFDNLGEALKAGSEDGAAKAREKGPQLKSGVADMVHDLAYGVAYGSVFAGAFLQELLPKSVRDGLSKGLAAGKEAGKKSGARFGDVMVADVEEGPNVTNPTFS